VNLNDLHRRLLQDVLAIGNEFPLVITGGYAIQAHGLVDRFSRDIDVATDSALSMESLADQLIAGLTERGWQVRIIGVAPVSARFMVTDPAVCQDCEVDILKEAFNRPPQVTPWGPVLALDDVIGTKVRALADRGYARDVVDIHAASRIHSNAELESLGRRCAWDEFSIENLVMRLNAVEWRADDEFFAYGLSGETIADLRSWAQAWADELNQRLYSEGVEEDEGDLQ
jgi:predicted nucleotidyltransferase component of viral defense system